MLLTSNQNAETECCFLKQDNLPTFGSVDTQLNAEYQHWWKHLEIRCLLYGYELSEEIAFKNIYIIYVALVD